MNDFKSLGLESGLLTALAHRELRVPTPIQARAIPVVLEGRDVLGLAQTGTGKTLAFGLPILQRLREEKGRAEPKTARSLILAPTRELAIQIADSLRPLAKATRLFVTVAVGGQSINNQARNLARGTDMLVATPGRLLDLVERGAVRLDHVRHLVLDEADQMLDLGFIHALKQIAKLVPPERQSLLFSATMPPAMDAVAARYLRDPERIEVSRPGRPADKIEQSVDFLPREEKPERLRAILLRDPGASTLVFARTKHGAEKLMKGLVRDGFEAASIHGNKSQNQRERAIREFREGRVQVLVATDVAARGIDVPGVACVVNYELPEVPDAYVHRIGRTARAGREGEAIALCAPDEVALLQQVEKVLGRQVPTGEGERPERASRPAGGAGRGRKPRSGGGAGGARGRGGRPGGSVRTEGAPRPAGRDGEAAGPRTGSRNGSRPAAAAKPRSGEAAKGRTGQGGKGRSGAGPDAVVKGTKAPRGRRPAKPGAGRRPRNGERKGRRAA